MSRTEGRQFDGQPLAGIRVLELGNLIAAPIAGVILGDLGAEVVKVENPEGGDISRQSGEVGRSIFDMLDRNKESVALDLEEETARAAYRDLAAEADVVLENLKPGDAASLGVDYETLAAENEGLVYLSVTGFLPGGPYSDRPGMDVIGQAMSGMMYMTGYPDDKPLRAGTSVVDMATGLYGAIAVMVALWMRERTGTGQKVETGLFEAASHWTDYWTICSQLYDRELEPLGSSHPAFGLYDVFETAGDDEWVFLAIPSDRHWRAFCRAIDASDLAVDERFETARKRRENADALGELVQSLLGEFPRDELVETAVAEDVPIAPVNDPAELADDPHLDAVGLLAETEDPEGRPFTARLTPFRGSEFEPRNERGVPELGGDTVEVLRRHGFPEERIRDLDER